MKTIYKYKVRQVEMVEVEMPVGARILTAQAQGMHIWIWAIVDTEVKDQEIRKLAVLKTGQEVTMDTDAMVHLGSVQFDEGGLVYHVFECPQD